MPIKTYKYQIGKGESVKSAYTFFDLVAEQDSDLEGKVIYHVQDNIICVTDMPKDSQEYNNNQSLITRIIFYREAKKDEL